MWHKNNELLPKVPGCGGYDFSITETDVTAKTKSELISLNYKDQGSTNAEHSLVTCNLLFHGIVMFFKVYWDILFITFLISVVQLSILYFI